MFQTINTPEVKELEPEVRKCKFEHEIIEELNEPYSVSACFTLLRIKTEIKLCNCRIHTSPAICKYLKYVCVLDFFSISRKFHK